MSSFKGNKNIYIQPNDKKVPYQFEFTTCSTENSNDGFLPYGTTITGVGVDIREINSETSVSGILTHTLESNKVNLRISYDNNLKDSQCKITFILQLDDESEKEADFDRVYFRNL
jgi:hypothetical protein